MVVSSLYFCSSLSEWGKYKSKEFIVSGWSWGLGPPHDRAQIATFFLCSVSADKLSRALYLVPSPAVKFDTQLCRIHPPTNEENMAYIFSCRDFSTCNDAPSRCHCVLSVVVNWMCPLGWATAPRYLI